MTLGIPLFFLFGGYFQGNKMVCVDSLVRVMFKMKDLCICMWLRTETWQKCTAAVLWWAVWVDLGSTAVFLSHHYSLSGFLFFSFFAARWLWRSGEINKGGSYSFCLKHTWAEAHTLDNVCGSGRNAIRASEICLSHHTTTFACQLKASRI